MLSRISFTLLVAACIISCLAISCKHDDARPVTPISESSGYPADVANIIVTRCAIAGCHNQASYGNADSLLLDTWDHMFSGDNSGAIVVPYWPQYSPLLYFVNTDPTLGPVLSPTMPYEARMPILSKDEYNLLKNWIAAGAPDKDGNIPFASNAATRQKIYALTNDNGVDLLAVIDAQRKVIMRYIKVGADDATPELGHDLANSSDGATLYESFVTGSVMQKVDMLNDISLSTANLGSLGWALLCLSPDNSKIMVSNWTNGGPVLSVNTANMTVNPANSYSNLQYPHGIKANAAFDTFFITASNGNCIYKLSDPLTVPVKISLDKNVATDVSDNLGPHAIWMSPDYSKYFVTCQNSNEVRVMDAHADTLIAVIPVGTYPQEIESSTAAATPYLFVTCRQDSTAATPRGNVGSLYVINYQTMKVVKVINGDFREPHGVIVDNQNNLVYVLSLNIDGPPQHHAVKNYRDGWYSIIDINTLAPYNTRRYELQANPYECAARF